MIISASRRTDIPKFFADRFLASVRQGFCCYPNPYSGQPVRVSLRPPDVEAMVFWSKDPAPLLPHLEELKDRGYRFGFLFTVNGYPPYLEPGVPPLEEVLETFARLSQKIGPGRVIWRYDPIILSNVTPPGYHERRFREIAERLRGLTERVIFSLVKEYRRPGRELRRLAAQGFHFQPCLGTDLAARSLIASLADIARENRLDIRSCAEPGDLSDLGVKPGKCLDDQWLQRTLGVEVTSRKDPGQRPACGCVESRDIGEYGTCRHGCVYCYARGPAHRFPGGERGYSAALG